MVDHTAAIQESNDRKAAIAAALAKKAAQKPVVNHWPDIGPELNHMEAELRANNLTIADLLRSVAKHFHGVSLPIYQAPSEDDAE